jgi:hypothetical protein
MTRQPDWVSTARHAVAAASTAKSQAEQLELVMSAVLVLDENMDTLSKLTTAVVVGRRDGWISDSTPLPTEVPVKSALDALSTEGARRGMSQLQRNLPTYVERLERAVMDLWKAHVRASVGSVADLVVLSDLLNTLPGQAKEKKVLQEARKPIEELSESIPDASSGASLSATADKVNSAFTDAFGVDSVREFLLACARGGATLDQLTSEVREWLGRTGAVDKVRVRLGSES